MEFEPGQLALTWAAALLASLLRSFTGFGFALAAVPTFALFLNPVDAVVLGASLSLALGLMNVRSYWGIVRARQLVPLVSMSFLGTFMGTVLLVGMSVDVFKLCLGVAVLAACVGLSVQSPVQFSGRPGLGWVAGLISGLMNGAMAIPGPPIIVYVLMSDPEPRSSRALMMSFFTISAAMALGMYALNHLLNPGLLVYFLLSLPLLLLGDRLGNLLFHRYGTHTYRRIAIAVLFVIGLLMLLQGLM